jgi:arylsulfatase A-like enzyme
MNDQRMKKRNISRRQFLSSAGAGMAALALGGSKAAPAANPATGVSRAGREKVADKRPNILFLFADDMRHNTIHALGFTEVQTPNLDGLVRRGTSFTRAAMMGGTHASVCVASRASLLCGRTNFHLYDRGNSIPPDHITLPEWLRKNGYFTFHIGKWHQDKASLNRSFTRAAKIKFGGKDDHAKTRVFDFDPAGIYPEEKGYIGEKFSSEMFSDAAVDFLKSYRDDRPFFAFVAYTAPHDPRMAPPEFAALYDPEKIEIPPNFLPEHPFDNGELKIRDELLAPFPRTRRVVQEHLAAYFAMITHLDAHIGRVLDALRDSRRVDDTIVVFAGDNGLALGQHGLMGKQSVYEHSVRVPLILAGPRIPQGRWIDALCYLFDLYPTLSKAAGLDVPAGGDGVSLWPVIEGRTSKVRDELLFAYRDFQRALRTEDWKLIEYNVNGARHTQLFDLKDDPWETKNLAQDPKHAGRLQEMRRRLEELQKKWDDPALGRRSQRKS